MTPAMGHVLRTVAAVHGGSMTAQTSHPDFLPRCPLTKRFKDALRHLSTSYPFRPTSLQADAEGISLLRPLALRPLPVWKTRQKARNLNMPARRARPSAAVPPRATAVPPRATAVAPVPSVLLCVLAILFLSGGALGEVGQCGQPIADLEHIALKMDGKSMCASGHEWTVPPSRARARVREWLLL